MITLRILISSNPFQITLCDCGCLGILVCFLGLLIEDICYSCCFLGLADVFIYLTVVRLAVGRQ